VIAFYTNPWASSDIRGRQIAERIGAVVDPTDIDGIDAAVFVKCIPKDSLLDELSVAYIDVVDSRWCLSELRTLRCDKIVPIALGVSNFMDMKSYVPTPLIERTVIIPQHHCNFDNIVREPRPVEVVGYCGYEENFDLDMEEVATALDEIGVKFVVLTEFTREKVVEFYQSIDINLCFRTSAGFLKNSLKIYNAGSFKIPTIAFPERCYVNECSGAFISVLNTYDIVRVVKHLRSNKGVYDHFATVAHTIAKQYHIDEVVKLYKELLCAC